MRTTRRRLAECVALTKEENAMRYTWEMNGEEDRKLARSLAEASITRRGLAKFIGISAAAGVIAPGAVSAAVAEQPAQRSMVSRNQSSGGTFRPILGSDADS